MSKILSVIKREYIQIVRTKGFIIGTILGPVLMVAFIVIPVLVSLVSVDKQEKVGVVDLSGKIFMELDTRLDARLSDGTRRYLLERIESAYGKDVRETLNQKVLDKELSAYIYIPEDVMEGGTVDYVSEHVSDFDKIRNISAILNNIVVERRLRTEGLDPYKIAIYMQPVKFSTNKVSTRGVEEDVGGTFIIAYVLVLILYMTLFFYGGIIMRSVLEEKNSRVVEIVLSSLKPFQLMMGKILGVAAVGFTQYMIWAVFGLAATRYSRKIISGMVPADTGFKIPSVPGYIFVYFVVFFILGYFLYATFYAAIGAMVNSEKEAQQLLMPVSMFLVIPILLMTLVLKS
ncbi:MAG: ABC transporter permease, partial [Candidatus Aminicenantes bacterium]|nr:ABC transporter permease [Candidatus Aminicenantes bacterium]